MGKESNCNCFSGLRNVSEPCTAGEVTPKTSELEGCYRGGHSKIAAILDIKNAVKRARFLGLLDYFAVLSPLQPESDIFQVLGQNAFSHPSHVALARADHLGLFYGKLPEIRPALEVLVNLFYLLASAFVVTRPGFVGQDDYLAKSHFRLPTGTGTQNGKSHGKEKSDGDSHPKNFGYPHFAPQEVLIETSVFIVSRV
jgi:hypothetical protein